MKKKNLIVLLIIPFLISALTIVSVNVSYNLIDVDVSHIQWGYQDIEAFKIQGKFILHATGVNNRNHQVSKGNDLIWKVENKNAEDEEPLAEVQLANGTFYLKPLKQGEVIVTCMNSKGNVSRSFTAILYENGVAYLRPIRAQSSYGKVDQTNYYGQFDLVDGQKQAATFDIELTVIPSDMFNTISIFTDGDATLKMDKNVNKESNKATQKGKVEIAGAGDVEFRLNSSLTEGTLSLANYNMTVVENGINVYNFDDLLYCTNKSAKGEISVLQTSFVAKQDSYGETECSFGYTKSNGDVDAKSFVEYIKSPYNHQFLDQWNAATPEANHLSANLVVGLHVKADMYGNGHMINFHNLAYPSQTINGLPQTGPDDLFLGPLPFYTVGNPSGTLGSDLTNMNLISAYGQDNIGMYVDGDNLFINDVVVKNCDDVNSLQFLSTVGTVVEVNGANIELRNMRLSNGRQVLRSFSNYNLTVKNCRLSNARNFLFLTGSNEFSPTSDSTIQTLSGPNGNVENSLRNYLNEKGVGDELLKEYLDGTSGTNKGVYQSKDKIRDALKNLQDALTNKSLATDYRGTTEIEDCTFYRSGVSCIALETLFNGPFLLSPKSPSNIAPFFSMLNSMLVGVEFTPYRISGTSYPVKVNISGKTKFYDYKTWDDLDVSGLINESISSLVREFLHIEGYSIDRIFPIKKLLQNKPFESMDDGVSRINIPIAFFGGGANYSIVTTQGLDKECMKHLNGATEHSPINAEDVDLLKEYLALPAVRPASFGQAMGGMFNGLEVDHNTLIKTVTLVTGFEPFKFVFQKDGFLLGEAPSMEEMQQNASQYAKR